uniref:Uncharacterized protein n=1 Tax=Plectus sambesii TaxID=2011161 RepID=A0A914WPN5_9BILA
MGETMTAEERRERRRRKVLENSESRINRILSTEGEEKRQAPMMEGGDFQSSKLARSGNNLSPLAATNTSTNNNNNNDSQLTSEWYDEMGVPQFESDMPWFVRERVITSAIVGVLLRVCLLIGLFNNALLPWLIFHASLELYNRRFSINRKPCGYPTHGYIVNTALYLGFSEPTVVYGG